MIEWTEAMKARLLSLVNDKVTYPEIAATMSREFRVTFNKNTCIGKARRLLKPDKPKPKRPPSGGPVKLTRLTDRTCHWPLGPLQQKPPYLYCGDFTLEGSSYCERHHRAGHTR